MARPPEPDYSQKVKPVPKLSPWAFLWIVVPALLLIAGLVVLYVYLVYGNPG